jgi:anti-sigma factor RsiW
MTMQTPHEQCSESIPWVVNGRASDAERRAVLAHAETCDECREELQRHRALQHHMRGNDGVIAAPSASWQKLLAQIDTQPATETSDVISEPRRRRRPWLVAALWLQLIAIAALAGALFTSVREPEYKTLSTPEAINAGAAVRVVFAADASMNKVNELLRQVQANIIAGPSEAGVYTLSPPAGADVQTIIVRLRAQPEVLFAEPSRSIAGPAR